MFERLFHFHYSSQAFLYLRSLAPRYPRGMLIAIWFSLCPLTSITGCVVEIRPETASGIGVAADFSLSPGVTATTEGKTVFFAARPNTSAGIAPANCSWASDDTAVLESQGSGSFFAKGLGVATVTATCDGGSATAAATVSSPTNPAAIVITKGGTYSGNWSSNDPNTPAVTVKTDQPVTIANATITGKGTLIRAMGTNGMALTLINVTGTGSDPKVSGAARGKFLDATTISSLSVTNCTMTGTSFGIYVALSNLTSLKIQNNIGLDLDDRVSDGAGGSLLNQRVLGHFIQLNTVTLPNGGDISWNQYTSTEGVASIEDIVNFFDAHGGDISHPIAMHDNYLEGAFATGFANGYTGSGIIIEGVKTDPAQASAWVQAANNQIVHSAALGIGITGGHDNLMSGNRVVSCGKDQTGSFMDRNGYVMVLWNYYKVGAAYRNNTITGTTGGLIMEYQGKAANADQWAPGISVENNDALTANQLDHPCLVNDVWTAQPEQDEWQAWQAKLADANKVLGDRHGR